MNKLDKIKYLLGFCTEGQNEFFCRLYKSVDDLKPKQFNHAIRQIETTLIENAKSQTELNIEKEAHEKKLVDLKNGHSKRISDLVGKHEEKIEKLKAHHENSGGGSGDAYETEKRLAMLDALEAGGVDNWEWYGESLEEWNELY